MSIVDEDYELPIKPKSFTLLEEAVDKSDAFSNTLYRNLSKHPFIHNVFSGNYVSARQHYYELLNSIYKTE